MLGSHGASVWSRRSARAAQRASALTASTSLAGFSLSAASSVCGTILRLPVPLGTDCGGDDDDDDHHRVCCPAPSTCGRRLAATSISRSGNG